MQINKKQFETLFQLYWKRMFLFTVKTVADEEDAKEIVQEVFKSLWERSNNLELADAERYLLRSVKLKSLEYLRNKGNKIRHHKVILHNKTPYYEDNNFQYKELKNQLNTVVESLPNQCKNVFKMSREEGLTNKEIAGNLLITERAVEYHISKALSIIRLRLSESLNI
ncbi:RNA polymerase sigma-70 factor [Sphingobacterium psychroaquaticum]|uniref:RNA polymerase sigma-70 factor, ECF subfamily n=1 Tax=Sphingobacterium psychroaquaticum TaxID=561061 RepID=A0A1X7KEJ3_9SPHI|nr:RNA polymerase sigma-70 factor [Sphingobacterium psychroaquaticum]SMG39634.1 RNA polymerase sigma-70 factor, ECF subfamily [Sphingobacterium psychroaquaticum]